MHRVAALHKTWFRTATSARILLQFSHAAAVAVARSAGRGALDE
jgi:hypothetical protein